MDWISFTVGFLAFPVVGTLGLGIYFAVNRAVRRDASLSQLGVAQRSAALGFSPRLIGEIGEGALDSPLAEPERTAKAS